MWLSSHRQAYGFSPLIYNIYIRTDPAGNIKVYKENSLGEIKKEGKGKGTCYYRLK